jgi:hypothetical protein
MRTPVLAALAALVLAGCGSASPAAHPPATTAPSSPATAAAPSAPPSVVQDGVTAVCTTGWVYEEEPTGQLAFSAVNPGTSPVNALPGTRVIFGYQLTMFNSSPRIVTVGGFLVRLYWNGRQVGVDNEPGASGFMQPRRSTTWISGGPDMDLPQVNACTLASWGVAK